jgi:hypothetical protein
MPIEQLIRGLPLGEKKRRKKINGEKTGSLLCK